MSLCLEIVEYSAELDKIEQEAIAYFQQQEINKKVSDKLWLMRQYNGLRDRVKYANFNKKDKNCIDKAAAELTAKKARAELKAFRKEHNL
jgi:hypothetical protein